MHCNIDREVQWPDAFMQHLQRVYSDHVPILLNFNHHNKQKSTDRPFRYIAAWIRHPNFKNFMEENWDKTIEFIDGAYKLITKLKQWNREVFGNIFVWKKKCCQLELGNSKGFG